MKATLKRKYIYLDEMPTSNIVKGLRITLNKSPNNCTKPILTADIREGQVKYNVPVMSEGFNIIGVEVVK